MLQYEIPIASPISACLKMFLDYGLKIHGARLVSEETSDNRVVIRYVPDAFGSLTGIAKIYLKPLNENATHIDFRFFGDELSGRKIAEKIMDPILKKVKPAYVLKPTRCEKCSKETERGEYYQFFYARKLSSRKENWEQSYPRTSWTGVTSYQIDGPVNVFLCYRCVGIPENWAFLGKNRPVWEERGDGMAIFRRREGLTKQGYDAFFTRQKNREMIDETMKAATESYDKGNYLLALNLSTSVLNRYPNRSDAYNVRGLAYMAQGELQTAIADFNQAIQLSENATYYLNRGIAYHNLGEKDKAVSDMKTVLALPIVSLKKRAQRYLTEWGAGVSQPASQSNQTPLKTCPKCAEKIPMDALVCVSCGQELTEVDNSAARQQAEEQVQIVGQAVQEKANQAQKESKEKSRRNWSMAIAIFGGLIALVSACLMVTLIFYAFSAEAADAVRTSGVLAVIAPFVCVVPVLIIGVGLLFMGVKRLRAVPVTEITNNLEISDRTDTDFRK